MAGFPAVAALANLGGANYPPNRFWVSRRKGPREEGEEDTDPVPDADADRGSAPDWKDFAPRPEHERRRLSRKVVVIGVAVVAIVAATVYLVGPWGPLDPWTVHVTAIQWLGWGAPGYTNGSGFSVRGGAQVIVSITLVENGSSQCPYCPAGFGSVTADTGGFGVVQSNLPGSLSGGSPATNTSAAVPGTLTVTATVSTPWANFDGPLWLKLN
jgi:hypothetical protein